MSHNEPAGPIATANRVLLAWLTAAGVPAHLAAPGGDTGGGIGGAARGDAGGDSGTGDGGSVLVFPVGLLPEQATRETAGPGPLRLRVRYLIAGAASGPTDLLDRILAASLTDTGVQVVLEPISARTWRALGLSPRLGLYADVPAQVARPPKPALPRVRSSLQLEGLPLGRVHGQVIGPGGVPVAGIRVTVEETGAATYTSNRGHFSFPAFPAGRPVRLLLSGRGLHLAAEVASQSDEPIIIHCDTEGV